MNRDFPILVTLSLLVIASGALAFQFSPYHGHLPPLPAQNWAVALFGATIAAIVANILLLFLRRPTVRKPSFISSGVIILGFILIFLLEIPKQQESWKQFRYKVDHLNPNLPGYEGPRPADYYDQFNAVSDRLNSIPGLKITDTRKSEEFTVTDCSFDISVNNTIASFLFLEHQDWDKMFDRIEGFYIETEGPAKIISTAQLKSEGIDIDGLTDAIAKLPELHNFYKNAGSSQEHDWDQYRKNRHRYIRITQLSRIQ